MLDIQGIAQTFVAEYKKTPAKLKVLGRLLRSTRLCACLTPSNGASQCHCHVQIIDSFLVYALLTAALQVETSVSHSQLSLEFAPRQQHERGNYIKTLRPLVMPDIMPNKKGPAFS